MKKIILAITLLSMVIVVKAQVISGRVTDTNNESIEFATIVLQTQDSTYINSAYSDSLGYFKFDSNLSNFRLIVQHLLYETSESTFSKQNIGTITLNEKEFGLDEVVIKGERPLVRVIDGKMTYDMPQLIANKVVSNAYESLLQLPGVREQEGHLILAGSNSLTVILNGKPTSMTSDQLMELLKNIPPDRIAKAEVMYSAPPQYHVRGAAINLELQKSESDTPLLQGQVNMAYNQKHYDSYSGGATLLYTTPKFSADLLYSVRSSHQNTGIDLFSHHSYKGSVYDIEQHNRGDSKTETHNIRLGTDYNITESDKISFAYTTQITPYSKSTQKSDGTYSNSVNVKRETSPIQMHNASLNYNSNFGLDVGMDYTYYKNHTSQQFSENKEDKEYSFTDQSNQNINRLNTYIDHTFQLGNDWGLNYGMEFSYASDNSKQTYHLQKEADKDFHNTDSKLKEYTYGLYAGFQKNFSEKLSMIASVTGEYYKLEKDHEWSIFPSLQATYLFSPSHIMQLSFSSDKVYPDYWEMHGAIGYVNGYTEIHGNPLLKPSKDYSSQLSYIFKNKYILTAYYTYEDKYFVQLPYQSSEKLALIYKTTNFDYKQTAGLNMIIPFNAGILSSKLTLNGFYDKVKSSHFHDISFNNDNWVFYTRLDNTINLSSNPNIKMEIAPAYITKNIQGPSTLNDIWRLDAGIKWSFANNKAELRLKGSDIFNSWSPDLKMRYANQNLKMNIIPDSREISLSFTYKFGGEFKERERKEVDTSRFGK